MPRLIRLPQMTECAFIDELTIGRGMHCSYVLEDISVSRQHCKIHMINNKWHVTDTSTNGILINRRSSGAIRTQPIEDNDSLTIGTFEFCFKEQTESEDYAALLDDSVIIIDDEPVEPVVLQSHRVEEPSARDVPSSLAVADAPPARSNSAPAAAAAANTSLNEELTCSICMELFVSACTLNCCHTFCQTCIAEWRRTNVGCPICRQTVTTCIRSMTIDNIVARIVAHDTSEVQETRRNLEETRKDSLCQQEAIASRGARQSRGRGRGGRARGRGRARMRSPRSADYANAPMWHGSDSEGDDDLFMQALNLLANRI